MTDYKMEAAKAALEFIKPGQTIGVGAGSSIANLIKLLATECTFSSSLTLVSSSFKTSNLIIESGLHLQSATVVKRLDIYFDGCDQFDTALNALKSGGGIHTTEKILASMAEQFILIGDTGKFAAHLDTNYPLVIEVIPAALNSVMEQLRSSFPEARLTLRLSTQKDGAVISEYGNFLVDIHFSHLAALDELNIRIKMIPGVVEHSLFYRMATKAIIAGEEGTKILDPQYAV
jgi:ribose 5-phosphate isomerase A